MSVVSVATPVAQSAANSPVLPTVPSSSVPLAVAASKPYRILVTGSRDWDDLFKVWDALHDQAALAITAGYRMLTIVHGDCPTGADSIAQDWALFPHGFADVTVLNEPHPAQWAKYGKPAGFVRNAEMVSLGADICLAFIKNNSRGATHCSLKAQEAGIPTEVYRA